MSEQKQVFDVQPDGSIQTAPSPGLVRLTHIIYALHAFSVLVGIFSVASVVGMFLLGWPSIIAVILNYVQRGAVRGTWLDSHFSWQIRTFWFAFAWSALAMLIMLVFWIVLIGIPIAWGILFLTGIWVIYRVARGWLTLNDNKPILP